MTRRRLPMAMSLAEARGIAGALGQPSKLPGYSYGLNARLCRRGGELRGVPGSVCRSCYAMNDFYATWSPVAKGHAKRHDSLDHPRWEDAMVTLIAHHCRPPDDYFRWHDSGDIVSSAHLRRIFAVCRRTPTVRHWLPTRELVDVGHVLADDTRAGRALLARIGNDERTPELLAALVEEAVPANLTIRLSASMIDSELDVDAELGPGQAHLAPLLRVLPQSTVQSAAGHPIQHGKGVVECRAVEARDNHCGPCRACWDRRVRVVSYPQH